MIWINLAGAILFGYWLYSIREVLLKIELHLTSIRENTNPRTNIPTQWQPFDIPASTITTTGDVPDGYQRVNGFVRKIPTRKAKSEVMPRIETLAADYTPNSNPLQETVPEVTTVTTPEHPE